MMPPPVSPTSAADERLGQSEKTDGELAVSGARSGLKEALIADHLSEPEKENLKNVFRDKFEEIYQGALDFKNLCKKEHDIRMQLKDWKREIPKFTLNNYREIEIYVAKEAKTSPPNPEINGDGEGLTEKFQEALVIFVFEFISYLKEKIAFSGQTEEDEDLRAFVKYFNDRFFNETCVWKNSLSRRIGLENHFILMMEATRIPYLKYCIADHLAGEISYTGDSPWRPGKKDFENTVDTLVKSIEKLSVIKQLDALHFFQWMADIFSNEWEEAGGFTSSEILEASANRLKDKTSSAYIDCAAKYTGEAIREQINSIKYFYQLDDINYPELEDEQTSWSVWKVPDNCTYETGRTMEIFSDASLEENVELKRLIHIPEEIPNRILTREHENSFLTEEQYDYLKRHPDIPEAILLQISHDYVGIFEHDGQLKYIAKCDVTRLDKDSNQKITLHFENTDEQVNNFRFNSFQTINSEDIPLLLQQLHRPRIKEKIEADLGVSLKEVPLATQVQLLGFMAEENTETFERLKQVLPGVGEKRQHFLTAFLACAKDRSYGYKILELAEKYPNQSGLIFERFYQIISITQQEEARLQVALISNPTLKNKANLTRLYQTMLERGVELLGDAHNKIHEIEDIEAYLQEAKRYQLKLIAFRGIFDAITAGDTQISPGEIEQLTADKIKAEISKGGKLLAFDPNHYSEEQLKSMMMDENNYPNPAQFSKSDYLMVVNNIQKTYKGSDESWAEHLIGRIPHHLMNQDADFILIRNEEAQLVGIGRSDKIGANHFYMGTFYVEDGYQGIGRYIGEYLKTGLPENAEIEGTTAPANPATTWHIEMNGYVGTQIINEGGSGPLIGCSNCPGKTFKTKDKQKFSQNNLITLGVGDFEEDTIKILKMDTTPEKAGENVDELRPFLRSEGYQITRYFYEDLRGSEPAKNTWIVLEKAA